MRASRGAGAFLLIKFHAVNNKTIGAAGNLVVKSPGNTIMFHGVPVYLGPVLLFSLVGDSFYQRLADAATAKAHMAGIKSTRYAKRSWKAKQPAARKK